MANWQSHCEIFPLFIPQKEPPLLGSPLLFWNPYSTLWPVSRGYTHLCTRSATRQPATITQTMDIGFDDEIGGGMQNLDSLLMLSDNVIGDDGGWPGDDDLMFDGLLGAGGEESFLDKHCELVFFLSLAEMELKLFFLQFQKIFFKFFQVLRNYWFRRENWLKIFFSVTKIFQKLFFDFKKSVWKLLWSEIFFIKKFFELLRIQKKKKKLFW